MNATDFVEMCLKKGSTPTSVSRSDDLRLPSKEDVTAAFVNVCRTKYKKNIVSWTPPDPTYPDYMLLAGDRGILAYIRFLYFSSQTAFDTKKLALPTFPLLQTVTKAESQLDRPVFFVWVINFPDKSEIRFETDEQIRDRWLRSGFSDPVYYPVYDEMGDVENLFDIWENLRKNNVRLY